MDGCFFRFIYDLPRIFPRKPLPAAWLRIWGGYEPVPKPAKKKVKKAQKAL